MPANLPPQYYELEREFRAEKDTREKLRMAEELLRMMPKHKGTDKLQAEMKSKISALKKKIVQPGKSGGGPEQRQQNDRKSEPALDEPHEVHGDEAGKSEINGMKA